MKIVLLGCFLLSFFVEVTEAQVTLFGPYNETLLANSRDVRVSVTATTWKTRGRFLYSIEGSVLKKLSAAGFNLVRDDGDPHELDFTVKYDEIRGESYGVRLYGTEMSGVFLLAHKVLGPIMEVRVQETSHPTVSGTPPYIDTLQNFQTNPYYFFLGEIFWRYLKYKEDPQLVFIEEMKRRVEAIKEKESQDPSLLTSEGPGHTMVPVTVLYEALAIRHAVEHLVVQQDERVVPLLFDLLDYPDVYVRVEAIKALGIFEVQESLPVLQNLSASSQKEEIRLAASEAIARLNASPSPQP